MKRELNIPVEAHLRSQIAANLPWGRLQDERALDHPDAPLPRSLDMLEALVRREINISRYAPPAWVLPHEAPDGKPALDVLIAGGGQAGLAVAHGLQ